MRGLANSELGAAAGYPYVLTNGIQVTGARINFLDLDTQTGDVVEAGLAYDTIYDQEGNVVTDGAQINGASGRGFDRFCSGHGYERGEYGFEYDIYFAGEENGNGLVWALDVETGKLWRAPDLGRGSWENVTALETKSRDFIALLLGDDAGDAPLYLYIGQKDRKGDFLNRNGLRGGQLYVWVEENGAADAAFFNGTGNMTSGTFHPISAKDAAGNYLSGSDLRATAIAMGAYGLARGEDLATNPKDGTEVAFNSTGNTSAELVNPFPAGAIGIAVIIVSP